jgi:hypothetical protein
MSNTIGVDNTGVITSLLVKDHPAWMWYREAVQNAIEASVSYKTSNQIKPPVKIFIRKLHLKGLFADEHGNDVWKNKLSILNLGGMTFQQLSKAIQLGGSGKTASLNANYGVGIKTSVLNWSDLAIITYKDGVGHFVMLGKEYTNGIDFDIVSWSDDGQGNPVVECTEWIKENAVERGYELEHDFTEVIILGQTVNQDTYENTFGFGPDGELKQVNAAHIRESLCKRYFRLPKDIEIVLDPSANSNHGGGEIVFQTYDQCFEKAEADKNIVDSPRKESVTTTDGIIIHYYWDGPCGPNFSKPDDQSTLKYLQRTSWQVPFSGLVWRNEVYDPTYSNAWRQTAFRLGIQDKFKYFRVYVELPDKSVTTDKYRTKLYRGVDNEVEFTDDNILQTIVAYMPEWYKEKTKETKRQTNSSFEDRLKDMFAKHISLGRPIYGKPNSGTGNIAKRTVSNKGNSVKGQSTGKGKPKNPKTNPALVSPETPQVIPATEADGLGNSFCSFVPKGGDNGRDLIIYNENYKHINNIAQFALTKIRRAEDYETEAKELVINELVVESALWTMICRSRLSTSEMTLERFNMYMSIEGLDDYLAAKDDSISDKVQRELQTLERRDDKLITTTDDLELETA